MICNTLQVGGGGGRKVGVRRTAGEAELMRGSDD